MPDSRADVRPGQRLEIAASQINYLNRLMRETKDITAGPLEPFMAPYTWVYAKNTTGSDLARWGVMKIDGVQITPTNDETVRATTQFQEMPVLTGVSTTSTSPTATEACVAIEPIKNDKIGRVAIAGAVQVKAADVEKVTGAVTLWKNDHWALVRFGGGGGVRLGTISATWEKETDATVTQINGDGTPIVPEVTFTAKNWFARVVVDCPTKKVACAKVDTAWILIAAECE